MEVKSTVQCNKRKAEHSKVERKRRCRISQGYDNLRYVLCISDAVPKAEVLNVAAQRLVAMQSELEEQQRKLKVVKNDVFMGASEPEPCELEVKNEDVAVANEWKDIYYNWKNWD